MPRPRRISDERILAAAREVFLEQGYAAPTSEVARRCDCSEGTLFKRYPTKAELFFASMGPEAMPDLLHLAEQGLPEGEPRAALLAVFVGAVEFFREMLPRIVMLWSSRVIESPLDIHRGNPNPLPRRLTQAIAEYLTREMERETLRTVDAHVAARGILSAAQNFALFEMMGMHDDTVPPPEEYGRRMVEVLWQGLRPDEPT